MLYKTYGVGILGNWNNRASLDSVFTRIKPSLSKISGSSITCRALQCSVHVHCTVELCRVTVASWPLLYLTLTFQQIYPAWLMDWHFSLPSASYIIYTHKWMDTDVTWQPSASTDHLAVDSLKQWIVSTGYTASHPRSNSLHFISQSPVHAQWHSLRVHTKHLNLGSMPRYKLESNPLSFGVWILHFMKMDNLCFNFHPILIQLYISILMLICINILPLIFEDLYSTLYMSSTLVAIWGWL